MHQEKLIKFFQEQKQIILFLFLLVPFYVILYKIYIPRVAAFGCFDDCFNYVGGYFIANGKHIYEDFFFNHQLIPPIISYFVQLVTDPINIYELLLRHRQFILLFGFLFNALLLVRFKLPALLFILVYELSKFYIFGDRFLAEAIIVYPLVYLFGLFLLKFSNRKLYRADYILSAIFSWFIIFSREPYAPIALIIFAIIIWRGLDKAKKISLSVFGILTILTFIYIGDIKEYYFNLVTFNIQAVMPFEPKVSLPGGKLFHSFLYPFFVIFYGEKNIFKNLLTGISIVFILQIFNLIKNKQYKLSLSLFFLLGLSNLRAVTPGKLFYESFHLINWYALLIFATFFLFLKNSKNKFLSSLSSIILFIYFLSFATSSVYFPFEKINQQAELLTNWGYVIHTGEAIKALSNKNDTLFLDRSEDLIFWQSGLLSSYKYGWYTSQMNLFSRYEKARIDLFRNNPPTFYKEFGICPKAITDPNMTLPTFAKDQYIRLYSGKDESCLYVKKSKLTEITNDQWKKAEELLYSKDPK